MNHESVSRIGLDSRNPLPAPPLTGIGARITAVLVAMMLASYGLAIAGRSAVSGRAETAAAIERAGDLERAVSEHAAGARTVADELHRLEESVRALDEITAGAPSMLRTLRERIAGLVTITSPELAVRLRAILASLEERAEVPDPGDATPAPSAGTAPGAPDATSAPAPVAPGAEANAG